MKPRLSVVIITRNEAANIRACLESVRFADEIVVVDTASTDGTPEICREFGAQVFDQPFLGYGPQKNFGIDRAAGEWSLNVDADERVSDSLREEIQAVIAAADACDGYWIARQNYFGDTWIRHGGWFPDYNLRLFRKSKGRFNERSVHEAVQVNGSVGKLRAPLVHRTCRDFAEFAQRQERYAELAAAELAREGRRAGALDLWLRPPLTFLKMYLLKRGCFDGVKGFTLARLYARYTRRKYERLAQLRRTA
jgi:glycosyltransferase involved in cell wall biosynthesis